MNNFRSSLAHQGAKMLCPPGSSVYLRHKTSGKSELAITRVALWDCDTSIENAYSSEIGTDRSWDEHVRWYQLEEYEIEKILPAKFTSLNDCRIQNHVNTLTPVCHTPATEEQVIRHMQWLPLNPDFYLEKFIADIDDLVANLSRKQDSPYRSYFKSYTFSEDPTIQKKGLDMIFVFTDVINQRYRTGLSVPMSEASDDLIDNCLTIYPHIDSWISLDSSFDFSRHHAIHIEIEIPDNVERYRHIQQVKAERFEKIIDQYSKKEQTHPDLEGKKRKRRDQAEFGF
jgi:hypothetical protein